MADQPPFNSDPNTNPNPGFQQQPGYLPPTGQFSSGHSSSGQNYFPPPVNLQQFGYPPPPPQGYWRPAGPPDLPYATLALVLSIVSLLSMLCYGIPGLIAGIFGLVFAGKALAIYAGEPHRYSLSSFTTAKAARLCSMIAVIFSSVMVVFWLVHFMLFIDDPSLWPWENFESIQY